MNKLFYGDNLDLLRKHIKDESIAFCYIDPPFNSKRNYNQIYNHIGEEDLAQSQAFVDTWFWNDIAITGYNEIIANEQGRFTIQLVDLMVGLHKVLGEDSLLAYLVSIALRVTEIQRVLTPSGSFYLHCDPTSSHYLKLILDSIFIPSGGDYRNEIIWKRTSARSDSHRWNHIHDVIFFYSKSDDYTWNTQFTDYDESYTDGFYKEMDDDGSMYMSDNLTGAGTRGGYSGKPWRGIDPTSKGRHWALPKQFLDSVGITGGTVQERLDELNEMGRVLWPEKEDGMPRYKRYLDDMPGLAAQSIIQTSLPFLRGRQRDLVIPHRNPKSYSNALSGPAQTMATAFWTPIAAAAQR